MAPQTDVPVLKNLSGLKAWYSVNIFQSPSIWWMFWGKMFNTRGGATRNSLLFKSEVLLVWAQDWPVLGACSSPFVSELWALAAVPHGEVALQARLSWEPVNHTWGWDRFLLPVDIQNYCISSNTISLRGVEFPWLTTRSAPFVSVKFKILWMLQTHFCEQSILQAFLLIFLDGQFILHLASSVYLFPGSFRLAGQHFYGCHVGITHHLKNVLYFCFNYILSPAFFPWLGICEASPMVFASISQSNL